MPLPQAIVTNPANGANKGNGTFTWSIQGIAHVKSKVIVGYTPGVDDIYNGGPGFNPPTYTDTGVNHPGGNTTCYTRPKYQKVAGGAWYTTYSTITTFTSTQRFP